MLKKEGGLKLKKETICFSHSRLNSEAIVEQTKNSSSLLFWKMVNYFYILANKININMDVVS